VKIFYKVAEEVKAEPKPREPSGASWKWIQSDGDYRRTNALFNELQDAKVGDRTLLDYVRYEGVSMWQFLPSWLWPSFFRAVETIEILDRLVGESEPDRLVALEVDDSTSHIWEGVLSAIGEKHGLAVEILQSSLQKRASRASGGAVYAIGRTAIRALKKAKTTLQSVKTLPENVTTYSRTASIDSTTLVMLTLGRRHWVDKPDEPGQKYDEQFYPLMPALRRAGWRRFVIIDCEGLPENELAKRLSEKESDVFWRSFYSYSSGLRATRARAKATFSAMWEEIKNDASFDSCFCYRGVRLMPSLGREMEAAFLRLLPECAVFLAAGQNILNREKPGAVMATYQEGPWARAVIIEASKAGLPTVGLQHGMIFDNHYDYMHKNIVTGPHTALGFAVPRLTCVWGSFWKDVLTRAGHYPPEAVVVTGNWRYDKILVWAEKADMADMRRRFGLPPEKEIVTVLSAHLDTMEFVEETLAVLSRFPALTLLIKLHPADNPGPVRAIVERAGYPRTTLTDGTLVEAILVADLVISQISTVVSEAALLGKPVILVNFQKLAGWDAYVKEGICEYATTREELTCALSGVLKDETVLERMRAARHRFIDRFYNGADGRGAENVAKALSSITTV
jgi:hypothetical protein